MEILNALGRRKTSVARIYLTPGKGDILVNERPYKEYFRSEILQNVVDQPFTTLTEVGKYDVIVNVKGGGVTGQAQAIRMAISRAMVELSATNRPALKKEGFLTRDSRMVERKKYGRRKARRRFQFSKR
ncbi:MAG TPA: 30S ribosomal protein S9 [Cytophagaceae bacterium]|jgi:small subunit ribosomal protein S9|nr:30S ribosomal protein S9 [Cytophagaceae bacterium]